MKKKIMCSFLVAFLVLFSGIKSYAATMDCVHDPVLYNKQAVNSEFSYGHEVTMLSSGELRAELLAN